jgi:hypothetical protein
MFTERLRVLMEFLKIITTKINIAVSVELDMLRKTVSIGNIGLAIKSSSNLKRSGTD